MQVIQLEPYDVAWHGLILWADGWRCFMKMMMKIWRAQKQNKILHEAEYEMMINRIKWSYFWITIIVWFFILPFLVSSLVVVLRILLRFSQMYTMHTIYTYNFMFRRHTLAGTRHFPRILHVKFIYLIHNTKYYYFFFLVQVFFFALIKMKRWSE